LEILTGKGRTGINTVLLNLSLVMHCFLGTDFNSVIYLMQCAAVITQLVAMRIPPQVWCHLPLELY